MVVSRVNAIGKYLLQRHCFEHGQAQDLKNCVETERDVEALFDDGHQHVHRHRIPDLGAHGILGGAVEGLDAQVLFDPFEEQFDLPATAVQFGNGQGRQGEVVGQQHQGVAALGVAILDATQFLRVAGAGIGAGQHDALVAQKPRASVDRMGVEPSELRIAAGADDEERPGLMQQVESFEMNVAAIHDVESAGFGNQQIEHVDVVDPPVGDMDEGRDGAAQVEQGVHFDRALAALKVCPRKQRQAQVDGGAVQRIHRVVEFDAEVLVDIEPSSGVDQGLGEVGVDAPVAHLVGVGQGVARHLCADPHVIELALLGPQAHFDVAQALAIGELGKGHAAILLDAGEALDLVVTLVSLDAAAQGMRG